MFPTSCSGHVLQVSLVTDMSFLFGKYVDFRRSTVSSCGTSFNSDISTWNTSSVTNME